VEEGEIGGVETWVREIGFTGVDPVTVAANRINFSVVGDHAEGVGERPSREGIRAVALMENRQGGFVGRILEVEVEAFELGACEHAFIDEEAGAEGGNIEGRGTIGCAAVFDFVAGQKEGKFKGIVGKFFGVGPSDEKLFDAWGGGRSFFSEDAGVNRDNTPTEGEETAASDDFFRDTADVGLGVGVLGGKKEKAYPEVVVLVEAVAEFFDFAPKELRRNLG
jgi:hypothetical protein